MSTLLDYRTRYAPLTRNGDIHMSLIGHWIDLAAYYRGSDGNAWSYQSGWTNCGPCEQFVERVRAGKVRGVIH